MRLRPRHWAVLDYAAGAFIAAVLFVTIWRDLSQDFLPPFGPVRYFPLLSAGLLALLLASGTGVAVALRRRRPVFMLSVLLVGSVVLTALTGRETGALTYFLPVAYVLYVVAVGYEYRRDAVRALSAVFATLVADAALITLGWRGRFSMASLVLITLCVIIVWTIGYTVRQRRRYAVRLQDEAASKAVTQERLRIARELHDVVAHSMSVIAVQAGYGQYVIDLQPDDARAALGAIQATSREALDEMRRMLGALRQADEGDAQSGARSAARIQDGAGNGRGAGSGPGAGSGRGAGSGPGAGSRTGGGPGTGARPGTGAGSRTGRGPGTGARPGTRSGREGGAADDGSGAPLFPAPGLADLDRLLSRTASAGVRVDVARVGQPRDLPASIDMSAYRVVQEALTNVVKHAQASSCRVLIGYSDDELTIEVTDGGAGALVPEMAGAGMASRNGAVLDGPQTRLEGGLARSVFDKQAGGVALAGGIHGGHGTIPGGGHGIIGMRERVTLLGGEFSAGPLPGYGFQVSARIPLPPGGP